MLETLFSTHPDPASTHGAEASACVEACTDCARACTVCADACLSGPEPERRIQCIRLALDCNEICELTARLLTRPSHRDAPTLHLQLQACVQACRSCADECDKYAKSKRMEHCRLCAEACRKCVDACELMMAALVP